MLKRDGNYYTVFKLGLNLAIKQIENNQYDQEFDNFVKN
jgi:hypothetical protein